MRQVLSSLLFFSLMFIGIAAYAEETPTRLTVYVQDTSEGLREMADVQEKLREALKEYIVKGVYTFRVVNAADQKNLILYENHLTNVRQPELSGIFPLAILGDGSSAFVKAGDDAIDLVIGAIHKKSNPGDGFEDIEPGDSIILYFYKENCPYCNEIKPLMEAIPETITLPDGTKSRVRVIWLNKNDQNAYRIISNYYDLMDVPSPRQYVPMVLIGNRSLYLYDEIVPNLLTLLLDGEGRSTPLDPFE